MSVCSVNSIDREKVDKLAADMPDETINKDMATVFSAMSDSGRLRILMLLAESELCVCEIVELMQMSQSAISHQLRILRNLRLVKYRKAGKLVYYSLDDAHIKQMLHTCFEHIKEA